ncbi:hypothetical protein DFH08DRAFT_800722 [Mycena albidolilacea]|uniref:Uncharacterized protein n=1 Tax=Mycena albidolilacea TaxID=1033008 RepID=A0AAD7F2J3_9AGAR|nr:hypothetical protein DFH08DRAFT_800722 [Mycena albidolilacea]
MEDSENLKKTRLAVAKKTRDAVSCRKRQRGRKEEVNRLGFGRRRVRYPGTRIAMPLGRFRVGRWSSIKKRDHPFWDSGRKSTPPDFWGVTLPRVESTRHESTNSKIISRSQFNCDSVIYITIPLALPGLSINAHARIIRVIAEIISISSPTEPEAQYTNAIANYTPCGILSSLLEVECEDVEGASFHRYEQSLGISRDYKHDTDKSGARERSRGRGREKPGVWLSEGLKEQLSTQITEGTLNGVFRLRGDGWLRITDCWGD